MKFLIVLLATLAVASCAYDAGFRIRFSLNYLGIGESAFYNIPRTEQDAIDQGWTQVARPEGSPLPSLKLYCPEDRVVGCLFDDTGYIAGLQVALDESKFSGAVLDFGTQGFTTWQPDADGKTYWTTQQYFVDEDFLAQDETSRASARDAARTLPMDGVWVTGIDKGLVKIANTTEGIESSLFTKQSCIPGMGRHYYYNMSATTECTSRGLFPWFSMVYDGELIGTGFVTYGKMNLGDDDKNWFETSSKTIVEVIVPDGPDCMYDLADNPGRVTMHIYYC